jgi:hypothetical protein
MILRRASRLLKQSGYMLIADLGPRRERPEQLMESAQSTGLSLISYEDRTKDLDTFAIEKIMEYGSLEAYYQATVPEGENPCDFFPAAQHAKPGYFIATFRKSEPPLSAP